MIRFIDFLWGKFLQHKAAASLYIQNSLPGTAVYFIVVTVLITGLTVDYFIAIPVAFFVQFLISQFLHSRHTFKVGKLSKQGSFAYFVSFGVVSLAEYLLAIALVEWLGVGPWVSAVLVVFVAGVASFFLTMLTMQHDTKR